MFKHNYFMYSGRFETWRELLSEYDNEGKEYLKEHHKGQCIDTISIYFNSFFYNIKEWFLFKLMVTDNGEIKVYCDYYKYNYKKCEILYNLKNIDVEQDEHFDFSLTKPFKCCGRILNIVYVLESWKISMLWSSFIKNNMNYYEKTQRYHLLDCIVNMYEISIWQKIYHSLF